MKRWVVIGVIGLDQLTKFWLARTFFLNQGIAFGWGSSFAWELVMLIVVVWVWWQKRTGIGWQLLLGGGISNFIDRVAWGGVRDFLHPFTWFPWFNLADVAISVGVIWLGLVQLRGWKNHE